MVIQIACNHEFGGNHLRDVGSNRQLCYPETTARTKVAWHREVYANQQGTTYVFLPCVMSISGWIHREFLRLLYSLAHQNTLKYSR